jgi:poly(3-hydroxybutyrate) depolymerase
MLRAGISMNSNFARRRGIHGLKLPLLSVFAYTLTGCIQGGLGGVSAKPQSVISPKPSPTATSTPTTASLPAGPIVFVPSSPSSNARPSIRGTTYPKASGELQIQLYADSACATPMIGSGTVSAFSGAGVPIGVALNATTEVYARLKGSACVFLDSYQHLAAQASPTPTASPAPSPKPSVSPTPMPSPSPSHSPKPSPSPATSPSPSPSPKPSPSPSTSPVVSTFVSVDDNDTGWKFSPEFYYYEWAPEFKGTAHGCTTAGGSAEYTFTGVGVELVGWKGPKGGSLEVFVDGSSRGIQSLYGDTQVHQEKLWGVSGLTRGTHVLRFVSVSADFTMIDQIRIEQPVGTTVPSPTPSPSPSVTPAGGLGNSSGCGKLGAKTGDYDVNLTVNGQARLYGVSVPSGYNPNEALPVLFYFHGSGGTASVSRLEFPSSTPSSTTGERAIIIYGEGTGGSNAKGWYDTKCGGNDMTYFDQIYASIASSYCVNLDRVYANGFSMGGGMSYDLGCCRGNKIRAIAPIGSAWTPTAVNPASSCTAKKPAMRISYGTKDYLPVDDLRGIHSYHRALLGCTANTASIDPSPCKAYSGCPASTAVQYCEFQDMTHGFPPNSPANNWKFLSTFK